MTREFYRNRIATGSIPQTKGLQIYSETKNFDSSAELTSNGWENITGYRGPLSVSGGNLVVPNLGNDTGGMLRYVFPVTPVSWEFSVEMTLKSSQWGGQQYVQAFGGGLVPWLGAGYDKNPGFWAFMNTATGYTGPSFYGNGAGGEAYRINSSGGLTGTWVVKMTYAGGVYKVWRETTTGTYVDGAQFSAPAAGGVTVHLRFGFSTENWCYVNKLTLTYAY